jgi:hypothetical protein
MGRPFFSPPFFHGRDVALAPGHPSLTYTGYCESGFKMDTPRQTKRDTLS